MYAFWFENLLTLWNFTERIHILKEREEGKNFGKNKNVA